MIPWGNRTCAPGINKNLLPFSHYSFLLLFLFFLILRVGRKLMQSIGTNAKHVCMMTDYFFVGELKLGIHAMEQVFVNTYRRANSVPVYNF